MMQKILAWINMMSLPADRNKLVYIVSFLLPFTRSCNPPDLGGFFFSEVYITPVSVVRQKVLMIGAFLGFAEKKHTSVVLLWQKFPSLCLLRSMKWSVRSMDLPVRSTNMDIFEVMTQNFKMYCWWKKSCTSWYLVYPIVYRVLHIPGRCRISSINSR